MSRSGSPIGSDIVRRNRHHFLEGINRADSGPSPTNSEYEYGRDEAEIVRARFVNRCLSFATKYIARLRPNLVHEKEEHVQRTIKREDQTSDANTKAHELLKHHTISRDQTEARLKKQEREALKLIWEGQREGPTKFTVPSPVPILPNLLDPPEAVGIEEDVANLDLRETEFFPSTRLGWEFLADRHENHTSQGTEDSVPSDTESLRSSNLPTGILTYLSQDTPVYAELLDSCLLRSEFEGSDFRLSEDSRTESESDTNDFSLQDARPEGSLRSSEFESDFNSRSSDSGVSSTSSGSRSSRAMSGSSDGFVMSSPQHKQPAVSRRANSGMSQPPPRPQISEPWRLAKGPQPPSQLPPPTWPWPPSHPPNGSSFTSAPLPTVVEDRGSPQPPAGGMIDKEAIEGRIEELSSELATLKAQLQESGLNEEEAGQSNLHWARFYRIQQKPYLGEPVWEHDSRGNIQLKASKPVWSVEHFLERNPQVLFLVYDEYDHLSPEDYNIYIDSLNSDEIPIPPPSDQLICLGDDSVEQAMDNLTRLYPDFETTFPNFSFLSNSRSRKKTSTSHLVFFYMFPQWEAKAMELAEWDTHRVMALFAFFKQTQEPHYKEIYEALDSGRLHTDDVRYLTKPGDVIIQPGPGIKAFMATSWPEYRGVHYPSPGRNTGSKDRRTRDRDSKKHRDYPSRKKQDDRGASHANEGGESGQSSHHQGFGDESCFLWAVEGWNWHIKGGKLTRQTVELELKVPCTPQIHDISSFAWYPLRYADQDIKDRLLKRGKTFWDCRERRFVGYSYKGTDKTVELEQVGAISIIKACTLAVV